MSKSVAGYAVPLSDPDGGKGTGFFGRSAGRLSFYTAGHNLGPCAQQRFLAVDDWQWVHPSLVLHFADHRSNSFALELPLFDPDKSAAGEGRAFSWVRVDSERAWDSVAFGSLEPADEFTALAAHFRVVDMEFIAHELSVDDNLICVGFPPRDSDGTWPYFPPAQALGRYAGRRYGHIQAEFEPANGFSGRPVFTTEGRLAGMLTGVDGFVDSHGWSNHARIVPARVLTKLTSDE